MNRDADVSSGPRAWKTMDRKDPAHYKPISDYGVIGDQSTCALVALDGSIDWLCLPRFDSPSVFGALLDGRKGGSFLISPDDSVFEAAQYYDGLTCILVTEFRTDSGRTKVVDFMPCFEVGRVKISTGEVHRRVTCLEGKMDLKVQLEPRLEFASVIPRVESVKGRGYTFAAPVEALNRQELALITPQRFIVKRARVERVFHLRRGSKLDFVLRYGGLKYHHSSETNTDAKLEETRNFWLRWARRCNYQGRWREMVLRSALTLKLLVYAPTGAIIAAPTTSLPEEIGGVRNWDYRYSWIRDSAFVLWAFHSLGLEGPEDAYLDWVTSIYYLTNGDLQVMIGINGERDLTEQTLRHLEGYRGSRPVRIGNDAWKQFQLDLYGILLDAMWFSHKHRSPITAKVYRNLVRPIVDTVEERWMQPDRGIWEVRSKPQHFVYSKVWCWVALDRASRIAQELGMADDYERWKALETKIRASIMARGWNSEVGSFVRYYGSKQLDAATLLMPQVRFIAADDPKMLSTIDKIRAVLGKGKFLYRYLSDDGLQGDEGSFTACSFWLVNCLTMAGRLDEAEKLIDSLIGSSNHLGLFSEELDPSTGEMLGNFPQAFTHMAFITAATALENALGERERSPSKR
jgi:GH15 family glucan-1,4-alpha-glucosidase